MSIPDSLKIGKTRTTPPPCVDILDILPELAQRAKSTIRLHPRRLMPGESLPRSASKLGGEFLWPAREPWPTCPMHELPWTGVLQLRKADFPEVEFRPGTDLLQVLWCPQRSHAYRIPAPVLFWRNSTSITQALTDIPQPHLPTPAEDVEEGRQSALEHDLTWITLFETQPDYMRRVTRQWRKMPLPSSDTWLPRWFLEMPIETDEQFEGARRAARRLVEELKQHHRIPKYAEENFIPKHCRLFPERVIEYPTELTDEQQKRLQATPAPKKGPRIDPGDCENLLHLYWRDLSVAHGTKLLGYVGWSQSPAECRCDRGHAMEHLLTIASAEWDGSNARWWRTAEEQELYDELQAARDWKVAQALHGPTGLMLGDQMSEYVFICRQCEDWPVKATIQH